MDCGILKGPMEKSMGTKNKNQSKPKKYRKEMKIRQVCTSKDITKRKQLVGIVELFPKDQSLVHKMAVLLQLL